MLPSKQQHQQHRRAASALLVLPLLLASAVSSSLSSSSLSTSRPGFLPVLAPSSSLHTCTSARQQDRPPSLTSSCARTATLSSSSSSSSSSAGRGWRSVVMSASSGSGGSSSSKNNNKNNKKNNNIKGSRNPLPTFKSTVTDQAERTTTTSSSSSSSSNRISTIPSIPGSTPPATTKKATAASSYVSGGKVPDFVADANRAIVGSIKGALFTLYGERHYARFHALETIARVPYFAYTSVLHLYETLGWRRRADLMKIHFAESWNELHHLLIMEELGGNKEWGDRVVAVHLAFFYYWVAIALYMASPETAYNLNEQVERHAFDTYDKFLETHEEELKSLPPPKVAKEYYQTGDLYMFDEFHTNTPGERRRPKIETLYDVFVNIRNDEREHFMTMAAMQQDGGDSGIVSPNTLNPLNNPKRGRYK